MCVRVCGWGEGDAYWEMEPVRIEGVGRVAQHAADASGVLPRGVEVGVVSDCSREVHLDATSIVQRDFAQLRIGSQRVRPPVPQQVDQTVPGCRPHGTRARHKIVKRWLTECAVRIKSRNI